MNDPLPMLAPIIGQDFTVQHRHQLYTTTGFWHKDNSTLLGIMPAGAKLLVVIEQQMRELWPGITTELLSTEHPLHSHVKVIPTALVLAGGEACKNSWEGTLAVCAAINEHGIDRHSYVLAIGGGAFLDMVGFATAIAHRGVRLIRVPTTVLAQADSGVGVKAAINAFGKKNFLGSFDVPAAVINDTTLLSTLDKRNRLAGLAEVLKVGLIKDTRLIVALETSGLQAVEVGGNALDLLVQWSARLHLEHITLGGDPFEKGSSRPLDFGHWSAHKLEAISNYTILHGEAVALGIALDVTYSHYMGWLSASDYDRIMALMHSLGFTITHHLFMTHAHELLRGLEEFREHLGGKLTLLMLNGIGQTREVHELHEEKMAAAMAVLATA